MTSVPLYGNAIYSEVDSDLDSANGSYVQTGLNWIYFE